MSCIGTFILGWPGCLRKLGVSLPGGSWMAQNKAKCRLTAAWMQSGRSVLWSLEPVHQTEVRASGQRRKGGAIWMEIQKNLTRCIWWWHSHVWLYEAFSCTSKKSEKRCWAKVIRMVKRDLCKTYESILVTCICLIYKGRDRWDHFGELEFVFSSSCFIFFHLNMLISYMCVRTK